MDNIICHLSPKGGLDDRVARLLGDNYTKEEIGLLRGLYDMDHSNNPLVNPAYEEMINKHRNKESLSGEESDIILNAASKLMKFKEEQSRKRLNEMKNSSNHLAKTFKHLYDVEGWDENTRRNRINMIVSDFTSETNRRMAVAEEGGNPLTREQIVNGRRFHGYKVDGQFSIFESIFDKYVRRISEAQTILARIGTATSYEDLKKYYTDINNSRSESEKWSDAQIEKYIKEDAKNIEWANLVMQEYPKIINNWAALCTFARMTLRDTEGLKLGQTLEYAAPTSPDNYSMDTSMEDAFNLEEDDGAREAWMQHVDTISAFGSLGSEVRRFLSTIIDVDENGNRVTDDLGYSVKMDPVKTHHYLAGILRGVTTESGMIRKLKNLSDSDPKVRAIFKALASTAKADLNRSIDDTNKPRNPIIITQLLEDMHKNMVPYTALVWDSRLGQVVVKLLNRRENPLRDEFVLRMQLSQQLDNTAVYDNNGKIDWEKLAQWYSESADLLPAPKEKNNKNIFQDLETYGNGDGFWSSNFSLAQRIEYIKRSAKSLGIPMTDDAARKIYKNPTLRSGFLKAMQEFRTAVRNAVAGDNQKNFDVIVKHRGLRPSASLNIPTKASDRTEYENALNSLNSMNAGNGMQYTYLLDKTMGNQTSKIGFGMERIHRALDALSEVSVSLNIERGVSFFDRKGNTNRRYSDRTPSYMGDLVDKIHEFVEEGDKEGLQSFIENKWGQSTFFVKDKSGGHGNYKFYNKWLQEIYNSITIDAKGNKHVDADAMAKVFQFDQFLGSNIEKQVTIFENFTEKQHAEAMLKQFVQKLDESKGRSGLAKYPCFILGDSGAQMFFTAKRYNQAEIIEGLKDVFQQEIERIKYVNATNKVLSESGYKLIKNFSETADEFTMLKFFNKDFADGKYWKILTGNRDMTKAEMDKISKHDAVNMAIEAINTDALTDALRIYMDDSLSKFKDRLADTGILTKTEKADGTVTYADTKGYFKHNIKWWNNNLDSLIEDFFWNTKYATIEQLQMFTVDPAFYDHNYPIKDLQKRYKEIYAPGKGVSVEARDYDGNLFMDRPYERVAYFDDISVSSEDVNPYFYKLMEKTFGKDSPIPNMYTKNTMTDGQAYRTLESYRAVKGMAGEWTRVMETAYQRIQAIRKSGRELTEQDIRELAELAVVLQPIKPYFYGLEKLQINKETGDTALIPVQHKYAEIVLIPELMKEGKLRDIALWMENHKDAEGNNSPIDLVASTKCVKVGAFGSTVLKGANSTESINEALNKACIHNLSWSDYRIQSGVPEHMNHAQLFGTQIRKLILGGIDKGDNYDYLKNIFNIKEGDSREAKVYLPGMGSVNLTGNNLIALYNCLVMGNLFDSYDLFASQTATNKALSDKIIQNIISNSSQSEDNAFAMSLIEDGMPDAGEFVIPLGEPGMEHDASALLFSLFRKAVIKQTILGGSAVQASAMGLSNYTDTGDLFEMVSPEGDNVLYDEVETAFNLSYKAATGEKVALKYEDWVNPDNTLKLSNKIVYGKDAREYLSWPVSGRNEYGRPNEVDENGYDPNGYYIPLIETKYKGILDLVAYRIPTERDYSMINCKVFRFSKPIAGGVLKVPSSRTTTAGFDFDIDKLYFFMREFSQTHLSESQIADIWNAIYDEHPDWKAALKETQKAIEGSSQLMGELSDIFKNSKLISDMSRADKNIKVQDRLFYYWREAGLEGTAEEAFTKYLENHRDKYPIFDTYDPTASPLNTVYGKDGEVVTRGNTRTARNNMLIDLIRQRLMDKETLKARYTPGGFENNRDAALRQRILQFAPISEITKDGKIDWNKVDDYVRRIKDENDPLKDPEPEYDVSDPTAILAYNQQNQVAGKLIGIFANQNTNHVYASTMAELRLVDPIKFGNHTINGLSDLLKGPEGVDVDTNVAEYLAASVDAVKDPVLNFLNLNTITADAGAVLARIGYTPQEIGLLFNQPIIKELCNYAANEDTSTDIAISHMVEVYGNNKTDLSKIKYDPNYGTTDRLADNIIQARKEEKMSEAFKQGQLQILALFNELMADTADINSFVQCTRFTAANSVGSMWGDQIAHQDRVNAFIEKYMKDDAQKEQKNAFKQAGVKLKDTKRLSFTLFDPRYSTSQRVISIEEANMFNKTNQGILNNDAKLLDLSPEKYAAQMSRNPLAFEQCTMDLTRKAEQKLFSRHFPFYTDLYNNMRKVMSRLTKYGTLSADTINGLHREFIVYLLSKQKGSKFDGEAFSGYYWGGKALTNREYYLVYYPKILYMLKSEGMFDNVPFFHAITYAGDANLSDVSKPTELTVQGIGGLQARSSNAITEMWADAVESKSEIDGISVSEMAENFYFYNYYKLGYNFHPTSSMSLTPTTLKLNLEVNTDTEEQSYIEFIKKVINGEVTLKTEDLVSFGKQHILNHLDNKEFVFTPKGNARKAVEKAYNAGSESWNTSFPISQQEINSSARDQFLVKDDSLREGKIAWRPVLAIERNGSTAYYMADNTTDKFNVSDKANGVMTYKLVYAQGAKGQQIQYFGNAAYNAYQYAGSLDAYRNELSKKFLESEQNNPASQSEESSQSEEQGTPSTSSEISFVEMNQDISDMFTDEEWNSMFNEFKKDHPELNREEYSLFGVTSFRDLISDTSDKQNVEILNDLIKRIDRGEKMKTIDENGKEIGVC